MKWIGLLIFLALIPLIAAVVRGRSSLRTWLFGLLTFLPFVTYSWHLIVSPYAFPLWTGYMKGWDFTLLDAVALGVLFSGQKNWRWPPFLGLFLFYMLAVALSLAHARFGSLAFSYLLQLMRVCIVFLAVAGVAREERGERALIAGLVLGLGVQALYAIWARAHGAIQTGGALPHQNLLGFISYLVVMPSLAMVLAGRWTKLGFVGLIFGLIAVILTASRASIALSFAGLFVTLLLSLLFNFTGRKIAFSALSLVVLVGAGGLAMTSLQHRFVARGDSFSSEDTEREAFKRAAWSMIAAKPMGVGPNQYSFIAITEGYSIRAGVAPRAQSLSTAVHNSYLLVWAETGFLGIIGFLALLLYPIWIAFKTAWRFRRTPGSEVLIGLGCGLITMDLHGLFEWQYVVYTTQYLFAGSLGLVAGLYLRLSATQRPSSLSQPVLLGLRNAKIADEAAFGI